MRLTLEEFYTKSLDIFQESLKTNSFIFLLSELLNAGKLKVEIRDDIIYVEINDKELERKVKEVER